MAGESWMQVVQRVYKTNKAKNSSYKFKQAMMDAKKVYKHGASAAAPDAELGVAVKKSRKHHRKSKGNSKSGKKTRKTRRHRKH
jgi:hypothetical protein